MSGHLVAIAARFLSLRPCLFGRRRWPVLDAGLRCGLVLAAIVARGAVAAEPTEEEKKFDAPVVVREVGAGRCWWFGDLMVRETGTDSPGFGPSYVRLGAGAPRGCGAAAGDIKLDMAGSALLGRKGPSLFYEATDAPDAEPFFVLHLPDGRRVYADAKTPSGGVRAVSVEGDVLHLRYQRGFDAPCSLVTEGAACWRRAMAAGHFSRAVASQAPPVGDCVRSYKAQSGTPASDASMIVYDVEVMVTPAGKASVVSRGPVGCLPEG